jgi:hypothetical protein
MIEAIAWPAALVLSLLVIWGVVKTGRIKSIGISKDALTVNAKEIPEAMNLRDEIKNAMDKRISEFDMDLHAAVKSATRKERRAILGAIGETGLCSAAANMVALELLGPLYRAVDENNFKRRLSIQARDQFVLTKLEEMHEDYEIIMGEVASDPCLVTGKPMTYPTWDVKKEGLEEIVNYWADAITKEVVRTCEKKVRTYRSYIHQFEAIKDGFYIQVCRDCIEKNIQYIYKMGATPDVSVLGVDNS